MKTLSVRLLKTKEGKVFAEECGKMKMCEIEFSSCPGREFLGFTNTYYHLSKIIPKARIVIDLGCAYGTQAHYFRNHKKYIGVDISDCAKLKTANSEYCKMDIKEWIAKELPKYDQEEIFGIVNYVPPWGNDNMKLVRDSFKHCFSFYVSGYDTN